MPYASVNRRQGWSVVLVRSFAVAAGIAMAGTLLAPIAAADPYPDCKTAKAHGECNIPSSSDKYQPKLDRDGDGIGCEC